MLYMAWCLAGIISSKEWWWDRSGCLVLYSTAAHFTGPCCKDTPNMRKFVVWSALHEVVPVLASASTYRYCEPAHDFCWNGTCSIQNPHHWKVCQLLLSFTSSFQQTAAHNVKILLSGLWKSVRLKDSRDKLTADRLLCGAAAFSEGPTSTSWCWNTHNRQWCSSGSVLR